MIYGHEKKPMVSIVMPVYNASVFLKGSIEDILSQTFRDFELICIDDGSTDSSGVILDKYATNDNRICIIHQENRGGGIARGEGFRRTKGKYVLFLDADDRFEKELLETVVSGAEDSKCDILAFNADLFDNSTGQTKSAPWLILRRDSEIRGNPFDVLNTTIWNKLFLRSFLLEKDIHFIDNKYSDTMVFVAMALLCSRRTVICNRRLLHYRINNKSSLIANQDKDYKAVYRNLEYISKALTQFDDRDIRQTYFLRLSERVLTDRLRIMRTKEAYLGLYNMLHDGGIANLGFTEDSFTETKEGRRLKEIYKKRPEEDFFEYKQSLIDSGMVSGEVFGVPNFEFLTNERCQVVLYGAGNVGRDYFRQLMSREDLVLCAWADKKYGEIGFPLTAPETIKDFDYDIVLIAINDEKEVPRIMDYLVSLGVDRSRIVWKQPRIIVT